MLKINLITKPDNSLIKSQLTISDEQTSTNHYLGKLDLIELKREIEQALQTIDDAESKEFYSMSDEDKKNYVEM